MRKLIWICILALFTGCNRQSVKTNERYGEYVDSSYVSPLQQIIIEELGQYKEIRDDNNYPDKIRVAFTRDGVFEDSIDVIKYGHIKLSNGEWEPTYIFVAAVGDVWRYDCRGSFIKFYENHQAHSGQNYTYNP